MSRASSSVWKASPHWNARRSGTRASSLSLYISLKDTREIDDTARTITKAFFSIPNSCRKPDAVYHGCLFHWLAAIVENNCWVLCGPAVATCPCLTQSFTITTFMKHRTPLHNRSRHRRPADSPSWPVCDTAEVGLCSSR